MMARWLTVLFLFFGWTSNSYAAYLFQNGKTSYCIVTPTSASASEQTAAKELQGFLKKISGATLPITNSLSKHSKNYIYIGYNRSVGTAQPSPEDESFTYRTINDNLYIWGGCLRGTMYGVFAFLENELGVHWYTDDFTKTPHSNSYILPQLNHTERPSIQHRLDLFYLPVTNAAWCAHNRLNDQWGASNNAYGGTSAVYGSHTFFDLVPPTTYFSTHPEYYSERNGKRGYQNAQLCLSNKTVLAIVKQALLKTIREHPDYWAYDVSQMDNQNYCQCSACTKLATKYGGESGLMLWFVNQVAEAVKKVYPKKKVCTFAYLYTRHTPRNIRPSDNVVIRLCDIECCFAHTLADKNCSQNQQFMSDLSAWGKLTKNIYIWDYVVNFFNYLTPYPNSRVTSSNIKTFADNGTIGVMEEGSHEAPWSAFSEMQQWILAKLLWNPDQQVDSLAETFCNDYYGAAGNEVYTYYKMTQDIPSNAHLRYNTQYEKSLYNDDFINSSLTLLEKGKKKVKDNESLSKRLDRVMAQVYYLYVCRHPEKAQKKGYYQQLKTILTKDPTNVKEGEKDLDKHLKNQGYT